MLTAVLRLNFQIVPNSILSNSRSSGLEEFITPIRSFVELGGPVVAILLVLSVVALALILLKLANFFSTRVGRRRTANKALKLWEAGKRDQAIELLETHPSALGQTMLSAMHQIASGRTFREDIEDDVAAVALNKLHEMRRGFRALETISQIAPLLGLFGTVLGMIEAFRQLQAAGNSVDPSLLAGGIWVALMTTAAGLAVAMPVSLVLSWFESRVDGEQVAIQTYTNAVISNSQPQQNSWEPQVVQG